MEGVSQPLGTVTLVFTDIEGSTRLLAELGEVRYLEALSKHREVVRAAFVRYDGYEVDTQGDSFFYAFQSATGAVKAVEDAIAALDGGPVAIRVGVHTGQPGLYERNYVGIDVHTAARIMAAAHGSQVVLSQSTRDLLDDSFTLSDLGSHRLKDLSEPRRLFQLGTGSFPQLETLNTTNLPIPTSSFVGRERELADLSSLLRDGGRLVTLTGPGGSGKTRLAIKAAADVVGDYRDGVFWVGLASLGDPALVVDTIAQTLGARNGVEERVGDRALLLVLDNFEHVIDAAAELSALLGACPNLRLLVTSRELLRLQGEVEYPVPPLAPSEAEELFCARSRLPHDEGIADLCRQLEDLPLALELAANRTSVLSVAQIRDRLSQRLDLFKGGRDADPRQQTLRATIEWSHDLLDGAEQRLFAHLAVFAGGCTLEAAEEVCGADLGTLASLVDKSLVRHTGDRFWMLETIRELAVERLQGLAEADDIVERHAQWYLRLAKSAHGALRGASQAEWLARLDADLKNLRSAIGWARDHNERAEVELIGATWYFLAVRGLLREAMGYLLQALEIVARSPYLDQSEILYGAAHVAVRLGDYAAAEQWSEQRLELGRAHGDALVIARSLRALALATQAKGNLERARMLYLEADTAARDCGDTLTLAIVANNLGDIALREGEMETARMHFQHSVGLYRELSNARDEAIGLANLALVALAEGDINEAAVLLGSALGVAGNLGDKVLIFVCLLGWAEVAAQRGNTARAARLLGTADALREEIGYADDLLQQKQRARIAAVLEEDDAVLIAAQAEGRARTLDEAVTYALQDQD